MIHERLTIILDWPSKRLFPNRKNGRDYRASSEEKERAARDAYYATLQAKGRGSLAERDWYPIKFTFACPNAIRRDWDNLVAASKAAQDGIAQALGIDDYRFIPATVDRTLDSNKHGFVIVEIG